MSLCGLDFGTSNSTVGILKNGKIEMVPLEKNPITHQMDPILPSAIFFDFESDDISFGKEAINQYANGEMGRLMRSMKNVLGTSQMNDSTRIKANLYSYIEIIGFFVGSLKSRAQTFGDQTLDKVVMGRPVFFSDKSQEQDNLAQDALEKIAKLAGFKDVSFQYEPIAAAYDYEQQVDKEELALIIDIGGGTSDFTIIKLNKNRINASDRKSDLLANHGIHIGGTDFDRHLSINTVMPHFGYGLSYKGRPNMHMPKHYFMNLSTWHKIHQLYDAKTLRDINELRIDAADKLPLERLLTLLKQKDGHRLAGLVEQCKIELSHNPQAIIDLGFLNREQTLYESFHSTVDQQILQDAIKADVDKVFSAVDETLLQSGICRNQIQTVFTTGGSTGLPYVQSLVKSQFQKAKWVGGDLFNSVGKGLILEAKRRYG